MGNNGLYIPSIAEITEDESNKDISTDDGDEINIEG